MGVITFVIGFFMTFFGRRLLKLLIFTMGFVYGGLMGWMSLPSILDKYLFFEPSSMQIVKYVCSGLVAVVCGFLGHFFWKVAVFSSGGLSGFMLGSWVCTLTPAGFIERYMNRRGYLGVMVAICGLLSLLLETYVVIGTSIILGAFTMIYGIDKFLQLGFAAHIQHMLDYQTLALDRLSGGAWGLIAAGFILALVGLMAQCHQYKSKK